MTDNPFSHAENVIKGESDIPDSSHPHLVIQVKQKQRGLEYWVSTFENYKKLRKVIEERDTEIGTTSQVLFRCRYRNDAVQIVESLIIL